MAKQKWLWLGLLGVVQLSGCKQRIQQSDPKMLAIVQDKRFGSETSFALINNVHNGIVIEANFDTSKMWFCDQSEKPSKVGSLDDPTTSAELKTYGIDKAALPNTPAEQAVCVDRGAFMEEVYLSADAWLENLRQLDAAGTVNFVKPNGSNQKYSVPVPRVFSTISKPTGTVRQMGSAPEEVYVYDPSVPAKVTKVVRDNLGPTSLVIKFSYALGRSFASTTIFPPSVQMYGAIPKVANTSNKYNLVIFTESFKTPTFKVHDLYFSRGVLMHEIGHGIGLADTYVYGVDKKGAVDHSQDVAKNYGGQPSSVMNGTFYNKMDFTDDDKAGLAWLYNYFVAKTLSDPTSCPNNYRHDSVTNGCLYDSSAQDDVKASKCTARYGHYDRGACFCPVKKNATMEIDGTDLCLEDKDQKYSLIRMETGKEFGQHFIVCKLPETNRYYQIRWMNLMVDSKAKTARVAVLTDTDMRSPLYRFERDLPIADMMGIVNSVAQRKIDDLENFLYITQVNFGSMADVENQKFQDCQTIFSKKYNDKTGEITP